MEKFKAVEKEMKTKAFSKEGLQATAKLDPAEKAKLEACQFLANMVEELERQIEMYEAEEETLQATVKKGKKDTSKADRLSEISRTLERHKYHQGKLELLLRSLENGNVETEQVQELEENIKYYVEENQAVDFLEDDTIYDDLNLEEDEGAFGLNNDNDRVSSQDTQSIQDDTPDTIDGRGPSAAGGKPKSASVSEPQGTGIRRPSNQPKSPLPALATLHTPLAIISNGNTNNAMKPAPLPTRAPGETLKYASAAAAGATSDKGTVGIAPLPPPPTAAAVLAPSAPPGLSAIPPSQKSSATTSPSVAPSLPASSIPTPASKSADPAPMNTETSPVAPKQPQSPIPNHTSPTVPSDTVESTPFLTTTNVPAHSRIPSVTEMPPPTQPQSKDIAPLAPSEALPAATPAKSFTTEQTNGEPPPQEEAESVYYLPPGLHDLLQSFEITKSRVPASDSPSVQRLLVASHANRPDYLDAEKPRHYRPDTKFHTPPYYPQEPFANSDDPSLYGKIDTDALFYIFYYRQNTYQQYMAAKALKSQSWRFHKQYQTWFQRHEEPKTITEEYEQGTYRFFDYESTW
jgi:CCR4-NOT transcription complex subunit 3